MRIKINGKIVEDVHQVEVRKESSDAAGVAVIIIGALACYGWWMLWA